MSSTFHFPGVSARLVGLALAVLVSSGCGSSSSTGDEPPASPLVTRLEAVLDQAITDGLPGAALAVRGDRTDFTGVAGVSDIASTTPLTDEHRFYLASVGKTYTAVTLVRLAADGLLNLDDPITRWLPIAVTDRIPSSEAITVRSLLWHTSGLFDFQDDDDELAWQRALISDAAHHWTNEEALRFVLDRPLHFEPDDDYRYSNSNYVLAALIAEAASGLSMPELIRNHVFEPLALQHTVHGDEAGGLPDLAHGYFEFDEELLDVHPWYRHYGLADGGIQASAADLAEFVRAILTGETVLSEAMRRELLTPSGAGSPPSSVALGVEILAGPTSPLTLYANGGKDPGARTDFLHASTSLESLTVALCVNASEVGDGDYERAYERLYEAVLEVLIDEGAMPALPSAARSST